MNAVPFIAFLFLVSALNAAEPTTIAKLTDRLDPQNGVMGRRTAAEALAKAGQAAGEATSALLKALADDKDTAVRHFAASALGKMTQNRDRTVPALIAALGDPEWTVRHNATLSLREIGTAAVPALQTALQTENVLQHAHVLQVLLSIDSSHAAGVMPGLLKLLTHESADVRSMAVMSTGLAGSAGGAAVPGLIALLDHPEAELRQQVMAALTKIGPPASSAALPKLISLLHLEKDKWNRIAAALALGALGRDHPEVISALLKALTENDSRVRSYCASALTQIGPQAVPTLQAQLQSSDPRLRKLCAASLGNMGAAAASTAGSLLPLLNDPDIEVRAAAIDALGMIGDASHTVTLAMKKARDHESTDSVLKARYAQALAALATRN